MKRYGSICALALMLVTLSAMSVFSQDADKSAAAEAPESGVAVAPQEDVQVAVPAAETAAPAASAPEASQPKDASIYGEVLAVNATANTISVQYYDYDSDEEKTVDLNCGADTKMENAASLNDVKKGDWVDAVYVASEGKNIAKSVMVEKEEAMQEPEAAPADAVQQ
jgi:Cu/Ag efflux protein CusF